MFHLQKTGQVVDVCRSNTVILCSQQGNHWPVNSNGRLTSHQTHYRSYRGMGNGCLPPSLSSNLFPISFGTSNKCYYRNLSRIIVYIKPTAYHIMEQLIFYAVKIMLMGNSKNSRVFNFAIFLKSRKFYAREIYMFYSNTSSTVSCPTVLCYINSCQPLAGKRHMAWVQVA